MLTASQRGQTATSGLPKLPPTLRVPRLSLARLDVSPRLGTLREFSLSAPGSYADSITPGPDGALWFTVNQNGTVASKIGRITPAGTISEFPLSASNSVLLSITTGPNDTLWFTEDSSIQGQGGKIGRLA